ncbi:MAG TPA: dihydrofolate reductase, partial [Geodermatophilus sp.]|nr:dihydrofolate reductase [Geodermatophilus sp.]
MNRAPRTRVHNFSISLDGFGTGEGLTLDEPFGHAGHRMHKWMLVTRFGREQVLGESGGTEGVDHAMAAQFGPGIGAEIMGRNKFDPQGGPWRDDGWQGWWGDEPPFHTPVFVL